MCKILIISPYVGLKDLILEVNQEMKKEIDIYVGNLYDGLAIAKSLEYRKYDVIISRGATARLLQIHFEIPVMEIQMTGYDILRTLTLLNGYSGKIGMMSYLNKIPGANMIGKLLNMDITFYPINEEKEIEGMIERASNEGVQLIIGDVISTETAAKFGIQGMLITSGKEAVLETIATVEQTIHYVAKQKKKITNLERTFEHIEDGILLFDEHHVCTFMNEQAKSHFRFIEDKTLLTLDKLLDIVPKLKSLFLGEIEGHTKGVSVEMRGETVHWVVVQEVNGEHDKGFSLLFKRQSSTQLEIRRDQPTYIHFNSLVAKSPNMNQLITIAKKVSRSDLPVIIYGEHGVGKDSLAQAIHNNSDRNDGPYVSINCDDYSESQLDRELFGSYGLMIQKGALEIANGGTLFIDAVGSMPFNLQERLLQVITSRQVSRVNGMEKTFENIRFIVAHKEPLESYVQDGRLSKDLFEAFNGFILRVPPLRKRLEDLDDLVRLFIASANTLRGKQISGLRQSVLDELKKLTWQGNVEQLKDVIEQMCVMSDGPFVESMEVQTLLHKLKETEQRSNFQLNNKTLQEVEEEVILTVLKQENYNQSSTAKRLGINRSTLWRKIKQIT